MLVLNLGYSEFYKLRVNDNNRISPSDLTGSLDDFYHRLTKKFINMRRVLILTCPPVILCGSLDDCFSKNSWRLI